MGNSLDKKDIDKLKTAGPEDVDKDVKNQTIVLVRPSVGLALNSEGQVFKTRAADKLRMHEARYADLVLNKSELDLVKNYMAHLKWGLSSVVPLVCSGESCPFKQDCPYYLINKAPVGKPCLVEEDILDYYTEEFGREYGISEDSPTERLLVQELAELIVYEMRATRTLAKDTNAELMQEDIIGYDSEGDPIKQKNIHRAWDLKERCKSRRMKILDALVGTRREQYKKAAALKEKGGDDIASVSAELNLLLRKLKIREQNQYIEADIIDENETNRTSK